MRKLTKALNQILVTFAVSGLMTGCCQTVQIPIAKQSQLGVNQTLAMPDQPAKFYVCGDAQYPCKNVTYKWQRILVKRSSKRKSISNRQSKLMNKKPKEHHHAVPNKIRSCQIKSV